MKTTIFLLLAALAVPAFAADQPIRVLVWDEQQPEQKQAYGEKFLGEAIAAHLARQPGLTVKTTRLEAPEQGLNEATLDATDVLVWWSHKKNPAVSDERAERIVIDIPADSPVQVYVKEFGDAGALAKLAPMLKGLLDVS